MADDLTNKLEKEEPTEQHQPVDMLNLHIWMRREIEWLDGHSRYFICLRNGVVEFFRSDSCFRGVGGGYTIFRRINDQKYREISHDTDNDRDEPCDSTRVISLESIAESTSCSCKELHDFILHSSTNFIAYLEEKYEGVNFVQIIPEGGCCNHEKGL